MKFSKIFSSLMLVLLFQQIVFAAITGGVTKNDTHQKKHQVIDSKTHAPVQNAKISLPLIKYSTKSDNSGCFCLDAQINTPSVLSVEKNGYKPFSMTLNNNELSSPFIVEIEKSNIGDVILETNLVHIGDDIYSESSANAGEFRLKSEGSYYTKTFTITKPKTNQNIYLVIGTVIGVDTLLAQRLGQSHALNAYASPPEVFFNGQKIATIECNGDANKIKIPHSLINLNKQNEVTVRCGKNLFQHNYIDYDDIELINLYVEFESTH